jgi:putative ABC transport system permease protein
MTALPIALRTWLKTPLVAVVATLSLALGVGAGTAVLSFAYDVLLRPLPYPDSARLVQLYEEHPGAPTPPGDPELSNTTYYAWRGHLEGLESMGLYGQRDFGVAFSDETVRLHGGELSPSIFDVLRTVPEAGRFFTAADDQPGHHDVVVLSDRLWRERFEGSVAVLGHTVSIDGRPQIVVGVAPAGFAFPDDHALLWTPFEDPTLVTPAVQGGMWLGQALGRLKPGATLDAVEAEGTAAARSVRRPAVANLLFGTGGPVRVRAATLIAQTTAAVRPALVLLAAGVLLVLLVGCANVANLLLVQGLAREREFVLRSALGASRRRLVRQLLTESLLIAGTGGTLGLAVGRGLMTLATTLLPPSFPRLGGVRFDGMTFLLAATLSVIVAVVAGVVPAWRGSKVDLVTSLRGADGAIGSGFRGRHGQRLREMLLVSEIALAVLLLVGAGLLGRSFVKLLAIDPGYRASGVLSVRLFPSPTAPPAQAGRFVTELLDRVRADGRVVAAGVGNMMPFSESTTITSVTLPPALGQGKATQGKAIYYVVSPGYAEALGLRVREGRVFDAADVGSGEPRVLVNDEFVHQYLRAGSVIGFQLPSRKAGGLPSVIIGVVASQLKDGNATTPRPELYALAGPTTAFGYETDLLIRTTSDPASLGPTVRALAHEVDPQATMNDAVTLERRASDALSQPRFATTVLALFAGLALVLSAIGVYGVSSYSVSQRTRELAVRAALGATRGRLVRLVLGRGTLIAGCGTLAGLALAAGTTRVMASLLFRVTSFDSAAFGVAPLILMPVAVLACLTPALRASSVDPVRILKS